MTNFPKAKIKDLVVQELDKELLIYDLNINKAFCLNETSAIVFQLCNGNNSLVEIADLMSKRLKSLVSEDFVWLAIEELKKDNLLENKDQLNNHFKGLSRREIVKKVGLATIIALPIITSVAAPSAAMAQSGKVGLLGACATTTDCISGLTCKTCSGGSAPCNGGGACCANTDPSAFSTGSNTCIASQAACDAFASEFCCSGTGIAQPYIPCAGFGDSICICN
ncbi:MAG TPA: hypothetical protein PKY82_29225 [Pyrinomonadaceae bacterium]|nr:hypothetical protein [Pyrinomonadaceae bacterium]